MSDRRDMADRLIRQKAVLDVLRKADSEDRAQAHLDYRPGDADATDLGRVRMDRGRRSATVVDEAALERFIREHRIEGGIVVRETINPALVKALCAAEGEWTDPDTGEIHTVPGIGITEQAPRLVVTTTDTAEEWAREVLGGIVRPAIGPGHQTPQP